MNIYDSVIAGATNGKYGYTRHDGARRNARGATKCRASSLKKTRK